MTATHRYVLELTAFQLEQLRNALDLAIGSAEFGDERKALQAIYKALDDQSPPPLKDR